MATARAVPARVFRDRLRREFVFMRADHLSFMNPSLVILRSLSQSCENSTELRNRLRKRKLTQKTGPLNNRITRRIYCTFTAPRCKYLIQSGAGGEANLRDYSVSKRTEMASTIWS